MSSAASLAARCGFRNLNLFQPCFLRSNSVNLKIGGCRTLFAAEALGLDGYGRQRDRINSQFTGMTDKFREKMKEFALGDAKSMIFTDDLKNMVHLSENKPEDLELVLQMMKRFNQQNQSLRFGNYVFGPVVMRMYHYLNQPKVALKVFQDPELEGFFDQLASFQVLCDLLYTNQMYQEILDVFEIVKVRQIQGAKYPRNVLILVFAACYKMNSVQSYEYALKILQDMKTTGVEPVRRVISYGAALALNQNAPNIALEILSLSGVSNYVTIRNLKISALADMGRADDAIPILRQSLELDNPQGDRKSTVFADVLAKVAKAVEKSGNKELITEFEQVSKSLKETNQISTEDINMLLEAEIAPPARIQDQGQGFQRQNYQQRDRGFRIGQSIDMRPRRNQTFDRERRSIQTE